MFPEMMSAFSDWNRYLTFNKIEKSIVNYKVVEVTNDHEFTGILIPQTPQALAIKPEGQRTWKWWSLVTGEDMKPDDVMKDENGQTYRIMTKTDFAQSGFYSYEVVEGYAYNN